MALLAADDGFDGPLGGAAPALGGARFGADLAGILRNLWLGFRPRACGCLDVYLHLWPPLVF